MVAKVALSTLRRGIVYGDYAEQYRESKERCEC
jgi:hypothetical protein